MGKGTIISGGTSGLYNIQINYDTRQITRKIAAIDSRLSDINTTELSQLQTAYNTAQTALDNAISALNTVITNFKAGSATRDDVNAAQTFVIEKRGERDIAKQKYDAIQVRKLSLEKEKEYLQNNTPADAYVQAWCADYNEQLSGEVGTIEVAGQIDNGISVLIKPAFHTNGAAYNQLTDGQLQPALGSSPMAAYYNRAMLPGWQKWMPTYRIATISNIDFTNDLCTITLDATVSTEQNINVNYKSEYLSVPIVYMDCNADAFVNNDRVVVQFDGQDKDQPKVVGFENNPVDCLFELYAFGTRATYDRWALKYIRSLQYDSTYNLGPDTGNYLYTGSDYYNGDYFHIDESTGGQYNVIEKNTSALVTLSTANSCTDVCANDEAVYTADFQPDTPNGYIHIYKINKTSGATIATNINTMPDYGDCFISCNETRVAVGVHSDGYVYVYDNNLNLQWNINIYAPYRVAGLAFNDSKLFIHAFYEDNTLPPDQIAVYNILIYDIDGNYEQTIGDVSRESFGVWLGIAATENFLYFASDLTKIQKWSRTTVVDPNTGIGSDVYSKVDEITAYDTSSAQYPYISIWPRGAYA